MSRALNLLFVNFRAVCILPAVLCLAATVFLSDTGIQANSQSVSDADIKSGFANDLLADQAIPPAAIDQTSRRPFVGAMSGQAFILVEGADGPKKMDIRVARPVFKAFGLTSDGNRLLYSPLKNGIPSGELYLEDLTNGRRKKVTSRLVLEAALSPTDENKIAFTFAGGGSFGLSIADLNSGVTETLVSHDVFAEIFQWSDDGAGISYFETSSLDTNIDLAEQFSSDKPFDKYVLRDKLDRGTAIQDERLSLTRKFALLASSGQAGRPEDAPFGFPTMESSAISKYGIDSNIGNSAKRSEEYSFRTVAPGGRHELIGENLLGSGRIAVRNRASGETTDLGEAQVVKLLQTGVVLREFSEQRTTLKFVGWKGQETILGALVVSFHLPVQSSVMTQGGSGYPSPGNCNLSAHFGHLEFAYDFQRQVVGTHALATADGLVVFTESSVTCNSVEQSCPDYVASGCSGSFLGNVVVIQHADGTYSKYAHMETNSPQAVVGTAVNQGLYIGRQGHTGSTSGSFNSCGDHLHFQRQTSPDIFGQSIAVDFADVAVEPLSCGTTYTSASTEISHSISSSSQSFGVGGGGGGVSVTSTGGTWSAISNNNWITITNAGSGSGNDTVIYSVADNSAGGPRIGTMTIGGHIFTVTQSGILPQNQPPTVNAGNDQTVTLPGDASLAGTATDDGLPNPPATLTTTWSKVSGPGTVNFGNPNALNTTANFYLAGVYILRLTANDGGISVTDDVRVIVNVNSGGGSLSGSRTATPSSVNLTAEGTADWAHWGSASGASFDHKSGVAQQISDYTNIGNVSILRYTGDATTYSWTDGTPTAVANTNTGVFTYNVGNGFLLTVPADTTPRTLKLYFGLWSAGGRLEATMSDGSASPFVDTSLLNVDGNSLAVYTLNYQAATNGQNITLKWTIESTYHSIGNITLQGASLSVNAPPANQAPAVNAGSDQTIALPSAANLAGTATDDGLPAPPATLTTTWSTVSGPGTVTFGNANALTTTASFGAAGTYVLRLTGSDSLLAATDDVTVTVGAAGQGSLSGSGAVMPTGALNLSAEGTADWAHWGLSGTSFNHKSGVTPQISNYTAIGNGNIQQFTGNPTLYNWTGGTPTASATDVHTGLWVTGLNNGYQVTVPADTTARTLKMYVGLWRAGGRFEASLSDSSAPIYIDTSVVNSSATSNRVYTLNYQAASAGQTLTIKWTINTTYHTHSNVTLQAATLF